MNFRYSVSSRRAVGALHRLVGAHLVGHHREGDQGGRGKLPRELRHGARHVVVRGDDDQRTEPAALRPAPGLDRVADRIHRGMVEIDATPRSATHGGVETGDLGRARRPVDAGDEEPPAAPLGGQELHRVDHPRLPRRSARRCRRHCGSSCHFLGGNRPDEPAKIPPQPRCRTARRRRSRPPWHGAATWREPAADGSLSLSGSGQHR